MLASDSTCWVPGMSWRAMKTPTTPMTSTTAMTMKTAEPAAGLLDVAGLHGLADGDLRAHLLTAQPALLRHGLVCRAAHGAAVLLRHLVVSLSDQG